MTKPLHPTARSIKTGQVIYLICYEWNSRDYCIHSVKVMGKNFPFPLEGQIVDFAPVDWLRRRMASKEYCSMKIDFFHSKRKALSRMKQLQRGTL